MAFIQNLLERRRADGLTTLSNGYPLSENRVLAQRKVQKVESTSEFHERLWALAAHCGAFKKLV